jgi:anti-sigma regulatory factor (Ser/Thr protein kinase)
MSVTDLIRLNPSACEVSRLNAWFDRRCADSGIETTLAADLKLCVNEILANLIGYGFRGTPCPVTVVEITLRPGCASATIVDNGAYFDLREFSLPKDRDLRTAEIGGFGIELIKERASRISYRRVGDLNRLDIVCETPSP